MVDTFLQTTWTKSTYPVNFGIQNVIFAQKLVKNCVTPSEYESRVNIIEYQ